MQTKTNEITFIIAVGGTIDKIYGSGLGVRELSFPRDPAVVHMMNSIRAVPEYPCVRLFAKDSLDMDEDDRTIITAFCLAIPHKRILITHGTDTMKKTAQAIAAKITQKTIVLTGAAQPAVVSGSDADFNVGFALSAASLAPSGVYIAMNAALYQWDKCEKRSDGIFVTLD